MAFHWKTVTTKYGKRQYRADLPDRRLVAERDRRGWKCRLFQLEQGVAVLTAMVQHQPSRDMAADAVLRAGSTCPPPQAHQLGAVSDTLPLAAEKAAKSADVQAADIVENAYAIAHNALDHMPKVGNE